MPRLNEAIYKVIYMMFSRGLNAHILWRILRIFGLSVFERSIKRYFASYNFYKVLLFLLKGFRGFKSKLTPAMKQVSIPLPHIKITLITV